MRSSSLAMHGRLRTVVHSLNIACPDPVDAPNVRIDDVCARRILTARLGTNLDRELPGRRCEADPSALRGLEDPGTIKPEARARSGGRTTFHSRGVGGAYNNDSPRHSGYRTPRFRAGDR